MEKQDHSDFLPAVLALVAVIIMGVAVRINAGEPVPSAMPDAGRQEIDTGGDFHTVRRHAAAP